MSRKMYTQADMLETASRARFDQIVRSASIMQELKNEIEALKAENEQLREGHTSCFEAIESQGAALDAAGDRRSATEAVLEATQQDLDAKNLEIVQLRADLEHARSGRA